MKTTKKITAVVLAVIMVLGVLPLTVFADSNGPSPTNGFLAFRTPDGKEIPDEPIEKIIYENGALGANIENVQYDISTNTLTLSGIDTKMILFANAMGSDFKINVVGENTVDCIRIADFSGWGCGVRFTGDGTLTVNPNSEADHAIIVDCHGVRPKVVFGEDVTLKLYGFGGIADVEQVHEEQGTDYEPIYVCENGQELNVEKRNATVFEGEMEGYTAEPRENPVFLGRQCVSIEDPDGLYVVDVIFEYDEEIEDNVVRGYRVNKLKKLFDGAYVYDRDFEEQFFQMYEEMIEQYYLVQNEVPGDPIPFYSLLYNRIHHTDNAQVYETSDGFKFVYIYGYNDATGEYGYNYYEFEEIEELSGEYAFRLEYPFSLEVTPTDEYISGYVIANDPNDGRSFEGYEIDTDLASKDVKYTATLVEYEKDGVPCEEWSVKRYVYCTHIPTWLCDYSFGDNGEIKISSEDWETSEWNNLKHEKLIREVEIYNGYDINEFAGIICEDAEENRYVADKFRYFDEDHFIDLYDFEYVDDTVIFTKNDEVDPSTVTVIDGNVELEDEFCYEIKGNSLVIGEDDWKAYVNLVDNEGNVYTPGSVITIKAGEKRFFWCETDFQNNASHGVTPYAGFSENDEHIWTLTPAGFTVRGGTGVELGYEGIESFGIEVEAKNMLITTEAPFYCWLYKFDGKFPGQPDFDWNALEKTNEFKFKFAVAPTEGWNHFKDGHWEYIKDGVSVKGLKKIGSSYYYFDANGIMKTGWQNIKRGDGKVYKHYFGTDGAMRTGWQSIKNSKGVAYKYYFGANGCMVTGWQSIKNSKGVAYKYYFHTNGVMLTGWQSIKNSKGVAYKYYFHTNGVMLTGWQTVGGKKYYFGDNGYMRTGWQSIKNSKGVAYKYYFGTDGVMRTGWQTIKNSKGVAYKYYFGANGAMRTGWQSIKNSKGVAYTYYFNSNGVMATGWYTMVSPKSGKKGSIYFGDNGIMRTGWQVLTNRKTGAKAYFYFGNDGIKRTGWQTIKDSKGVAHKYYFRDDGSMVANTSLKIGKKTYKFNKSGVCTNA